jgi:predicted alpha/beta-fold hydrolase
VTAEDDPIIPVGDVRGLRRPPTLALDVQRFGGHCGYVENLRMRAWIDSRVRDLLDLNTYS